MSEHDSVEDINPENKNLTEYDRIWKKIRDSMNITAKESIPKLYEALKKEGYNAKEARDKIKKDAINIWKPETIDKLIPEEAKQEIKVLAGKKGGIMKSEQQAKNESARSNLAEIIPEEVKYKDEVSNLEKFRREHGEGEQEKQYNVTIYFAGKDVTVKVIAKQLIDVIPPNKYVRVEIN